MTQSTTLLMRGADNGMLLSVTVDVKANTYSKPRLLRKVVSDAPTHRGNARALAQTSGARQI